MFKLFDIWPCDVVVNDPGLKRYINLDPRLFPKTKGKFAKKRFGKIKMHIVERLINALQVPGHRGKKHKIITHWASGKYNKEVKIVIKAFKLIEEKTKQNPLQIFVNAIENSAPRDEITTIEYGGARYPVAVDISPMRRIALAIRHIVWGAYDRGFNSKKKIHEALAEEIIAASENSQDSFAIKKKIEMERQADSAR
jgi:small subunit ribosomal protein S7